MAEQTTVKISVILPVYNVEAYLEECLDSLLEQTLQEIEVICVDDGSPDGSWQILERYAATDPRVHIISQENQGQGVARNRGLKEAKGKYVYFMDSDDYLTEPTSLFTMYDSIEKNGLDFLSFNFKTVGIVQEDHIRDISVNVVMDGKKYMQEDGVFVMPWLRLFRREFLIELNFSFLSMTQLEDAEAFPRLCSAAKKVQHIEEILIAWRQRENSCTRLQFSSAKIEGYLATIKIYLTLSEREEDKVVSAFLHKKGLLYLFEFYQKVLVEKSIENISFDKLFAECDMSWLEIKLLKNEARFIKNVEIVGRKKLSNPWVYYMRRFGIYYFKHIRKYGSK